MSKIFRHALLVTFIALAALLVVSPQPVYAGILDDIAQGIGGLLYTLFVFVPGWILALLSNVLVWVLKYNDFGRETIINNGWVILRDISNMFFIIIMLVIAIGTILKSPKYGYQNNLRRLLLMAILINFSKTIALFFIDFSQAVTISFANAFIGSIQAGIPQLLGITGILDLSKAQNISGASVLVQIFLSGIMIVIACIVVGVISILLLFRIVYLSFLVMLSPLAFLASTWSKGFSYYERWWNELGNYLVLGPILTFFLWLSFSAVQLSGDSTTNGTISTLNKGGATSAVTIDPNTGLPATTGGTPGAVSLGSSNDEPLADAMKRYFIGIILLMGSLFMAQELGVAGGNIAKSATNKITGTAKSAARNVLVGRSGAGGIVGTARNLGFAGANALQIPRLQQFGQDLKFQYNQGVGRLAEGAASRIKGEGFVAAGARGLVRRSIKGAGDAVRLGVGTVTGAIPAGAALQGVVRAGQGAHNQQIKGEMDRLKNANEDDLKEALYSASRETATAAAAILQTKGYFKKKDNKTDAKYAKNLLEANQNAVYDEFKEFRKGHLDTFSRSDQAKELRKADSEGKVAELLASQVTYSSELVDAMKDANLKEKDIEDGANRMTNDALAAFVTANRQNLQSQYTNMSPVQQQNYTSDPEFMKWLKLAAKVDKEEAHIYGQDLAANNGVFQSGGAANAAQYNEVVLNKLGRAIKTKNSEDYSVEALRRLAPHMNKGVLNHIAGSGDAPQKDAIISAVESSWARKDLPEDNEARKEFDRLPEEIKKSINDAFKVVQHGELFKGILQAIKIDTSGTPTTPGSTAGTPPPTGGPATPPPAGGGPTPPTPAGGPAGPTATPPPAPGAGPTPAAPSAGGPTYGRRARRGGPGTGPGPTTP